MKLLRTLLSVPGNREKMIHKARNLPADALVLDLEDSVLPSEKVETRSMVRDSISGMSQRGQKVFVRINPINGEFGRSDLEAVITPGIDGINLPKPEYAEDIHNIDKIITTLEQKNGIPEGYVKIIPWLETPKAIINAYEIASASPRIAGVMFGAEDFTLETGIVRSDDASELLTPRILVVIAAKAANVMAIDTPYMDFRDEQGLIRETEKIRDLGYEGKFLIHPNQIEPVNRILRPPPEDIEYAKRVVQAFEEAEAKGFASTSLDGKVVDIPIVERARKLLYKADSIVSMEKRFE